MPHERRPLLAARSKPLCEVLGENGLATVRCFVVDLLFIAMRLTAVVRAHGTARKPAARQAAEAAPETAPEAADGGTRAPDAEAIADAWTLVRNAKDWAIALSRALYAEMVGYARRPGLPSEPRPPRPEAAAEAVPGPALSPELEAAAAAAWAAEQEPSRQAAAAIAAFARQQRAEQQRATEAAIQAMLATTPVPAIIADIRDNLAVAAEILGETAELKRIAAAAEQALAPFAPPKPPAARPADPRDEPPPSVLGPGITCLLEGSDPADPRLKELLPRWAYDWAVRTGRIKPPPDTG